MNRTLMFGIAIFFAVLGISLVGGENQAVAGHGCHGLFGGGGRCHGGGLFGGHRANRCGGYVATCGGHKRCHGGLFARLRARKAARCHGAPACCGDPAPTCCAPAPAPTCGAPEPTCCAPEPTCCAPEPTCCGGGGAVPAGEVIYEDFPAEGAPVEAAPEADVVPEAPAAPAGDAA